MLSFFDFQSLTSEEHSFPLFFSPANQFFFHQNQHGGSYGNSRNITIIIIVSRAGGNFKLIIFH